jgi:endonuclease YncB( thermonuclease family)
MTRKSNALKLIFGLALLLSFASCTTPGASEILPSDSQNQSTEQSVVSAAVSDSASSSFSSVDYVDDGSVKLGLDYAGHDFYKDGIGQVTLKSPIDGDTAHFTPLVTTTSAKTIEARFYGIDTPESTCTVEPWGKAAAAFTTEKLKKADADGTIVVSAPITQYQEPSLDSTSVRYVSMVWISLDTKNCPKDQLILLNLWIVQEGYSLLKNISEMPSYSDTFLAAESQARAMKIHLFDPNPDPGYNYGDYKETSILQIKEEVEKSLADPTYKNAYDNKRVRIQGTVAGFANKVLYLESYFTPEHGGRVSPGEYAGINIFVGMATIPSKYTIKNTYLELCGLCVNSDIFGFQISSASFPQYATEDTDAKVLVKAADNTEYALHTFEFAPDAISTSDYSYLNCSVKLTAPVTVTGGYKSDSDAYTLYLSYNGNKLPFDVYVPFVYKPDPDNHPNTTYTTVDEFKGQQFNLSGVYTARISGSKVYFQFNPSGNADFTIASGA